jgi:predicted aspartyl protease
MAILTGFLAATILASSPTAAAPTKAQVVPTTFEAGHFYAVPETLKGQRLKLLVDTGGGGFGGMYWITKAAAHRLQLKTTTCTIGKRKHTVSPLPHYQPGRALPSPLPGPCGKAMLVFDTYDVDGQTGAGYLPGRVWTFDYPARRLSLEGAAWQPDPAAHATTLGFPRGADGQPDSGMARIVIRVDGQPLNMLLDTGATARPTAAGEKASHTPTVNGEGVTSYITTSMLDRWHKAHPHWRVVSKGDNALAPRFMARLIEVPKVEIAGWSVGPVWFTERPNAAFHGFMASMMDKTPEGAVGANVFKHFVMTIDYPHSTAYFRCVHGCKAATRGE